MACFDEIIRQHALGVRIFC